MSPPALLRQLRQSVQRRRIGVVLALALPWLLVAVTLAWHWGGGLAWLLPTAVLVALVISAWRAVRAIDAAWLSRQLDRQRRDLEDSAALLFVDGAGLPPLARWQRARLQQRLAATPRADLRGRWPLRQLAVNGSVVIAFAVGVWSWRASTANFIAPASMAESAHVDRPRHTRIISQRLNVRPPSYTGLPTRHEATLEARVAEGSTLGWALRFAPQPASAELLFHDGTRLSLQRRGEDWTASRQVRMSTLYRLALGSAPPLAGARLQRIDVVADQAPQIRVIEPERSLALLENKQAQWSLAFEASDDFGLGAAQLQIILAQGSGENISVRARSLDLHGTGSTRRRSYRRRLDLAALGFAVGDDLVVRLAISDKRAPTAQTTRSASFILRWPADAGAEAIGVEAMVRRTLPAYLRSQRQIIVESEALLAKRSKLAGDEYRKRSDEIGVDQRILRLRYGQFLGEESEGGRKAPTPPVNGAAAAPADEHQDADTGASAALVESYGHAHDIAEAATLLDPETRARLKSALDQMWQAELHLRQGQPEKALPFEYRALRFIKQVQQADRIYLARVGLELPPIDESRRLGGDRTGLQSRRDALTRGKIEASPVLQLWQALDSKRRAPASTALDAFERWLRMRESRLPNALDLFAAVDDLRRTPACADCAKKLRSRLWPLLTPPAPAVEGQRETDHAGRAYLDALRTQAQP